MRPSLAILFSHACRTYYTFLSILPGIITSLLLVVSMGFFTCYTSYS